MTRKPAPMQPPLRIAAAVKRETRTQFAALPYRIKKKGQVDVMLISSLDTGRWIIPKGWPMDGMRPAEAAAQEAWEEAGLRGRVFDDVLGLYSYSKFLDEDLSIPCIVVVFPLEVAHEDAAFPEAGKRKIKWMSRKKAALRVDEPELKQIIAAFDPERLG
ncbi:NUDIX hydrolase [uncultured Roseicyclus sp.]|jgi:8-oxo-dGTP pyrophosphatase MutT (NUDIX family)|uniref:NUDIX hydrolase n=1 Tax=uncultured Roseicyclus sp. TaxID=543072 RepID=UPI00262C4D9A|nr:NUDIX hydrolase [uncultured Roseicyclus sp.]